MKKLESNYNFISHEKEIREFWEKENIFKKLLEKNKNGKKYRFIDGPITANNSMKIHHVWGRTLKDTFLRYKAMNGYISHYRNGFDGQGLWVEVEVEKEFGFKTKKDIEAFGLDKFTDACVSRVKKYSEVITEQSKVLGQWMDWDNSYYTLTDENITSIWYFLKKCHENGWIIKTYRPMPWCKRCGTSLSEHEMSGSYHDVEHEAVFFKLPLINREENILVWTTTPWTLSANVALAVNPEYEYVSVKFPNEDKPLIMCKDVYYDRFKKDNGEILNTYKGTDLEGLLYETCFPEIVKQSEIEHKIVLWDMVSKEEGSGIVHIAPGCGAEDFDLGQSLNLPIITPIDENGCFYEGFSFYSGKNTSEVNELVFEELKKRNKLHFTHKIKHSYPFCWRCKEDIVFRLDECYTISVEELRPKLIKNAQSVKWYPEYQGKRMQDWLENMSNWNISRKRFYGLPLPFYPCECGHLTVVGSKQELDELCVNKDSLKNLKELHRPWIDDIKIKCPKCGASVSRISEVGDVWLDAGIVPFSTLKYFTDKEYWKEYFPAEYVVEMHEQVRLWFYSMLFMSTVLEDKAPYEAVGTHGMVQAEDGSKFSKTGFNISFEASTEKIGVDASRYLYASANPVNNVRFGFNLGEEAKRKLLSLWNMTIFFNTYASVDKIDLTNFSLDEKLLTVTDKWLLKITDNFIIEATNYMENYNTRDVSLLFENYIDDVSNFYIRVNRRRFWKSEDDLDKRVAYYVLFNSIKSTTQIMAPIIPFMCEYIWLNIIKEYDKNTESSVHLCSWPESSNITIEQNIIATTKYVRDIITSALKLRNESVIKVRQPLNSLYILDNSIDISEYKEIIKTEVNVLNIEILNNFDNLKQKYLTLNFKNAGSVLKDKVNQVKEKLELVKFNKEFIEQVSNNKSIKLDDFETELNSTLFNIEYIEQPGIKINAENSITVALDTNITKELSDAGIIRDIIRQCQVFRKTANFSVEDRIFIDFITDDEELLKLINKNEVIIQNELLATITKLNEFDSESNISEDKINLSIKMKKNTLS